MAQSESVCAAALAVRDGSRHDRRRSGRDGHAGVGGRAGRRRRRPTSPATIGSPGSAAGSFELTVSMRGFETVVRNVALGPDTPAVDVVLAVGRVTTVGDGHRDRRQGDGHAACPSPTSTCRRRSARFPQELIRQQGINTIGDALRNASGVQAIRWYGAYEQYTDPRLLRRRSRRLQRRAARRHAPQRQPLRHADQQRRGDRSAQGAELHPLRARRARRQHQHHPQEAAGGSLRRRDLPRRPVQHAPGRRWARRGRWAAATACCTAPTSSFEASDGWRDAGADRFNVAPSLTWLMSRPGAADAAPGVRPRPLRRRRRRAAQHHRPAELPA